MLFCQIIISLKYKYLACGDVSYFILPTTTIILQTLICLHICREKICNPKNNSGSKLTSKQKQIPPQPKESQHLPLLKQTAGSVVSSKPAQIAFITAPFSNFPVTKNECLRIGNPDQYLSEKHTVQTSILPIIDNQSRQYGNITS